MTRPVTLFTGQWADLPFEEVCRLASEWGFDGLEIACWGDHLDPWRAAEDDAYVVTFTTDEANDRSECLVLDVRRISDGPIARLRLPERISSGTHAAWASAGSLR